MWIQDISQQTHLWEVFQNSSFQDGPTTYTSSTSTPLLDHYHAPFQYWAIFLAVFPILTVFGNVLVVLSVLREANLHTATNYFILNLAVADISLALFVMPPSAWVEANNGQWLYGVILCDIFIMFDVLLCTASIFNLAAISIDRYVAVTKPITYSRHSNGFRVGITITLTWILSLAIALPIACGLNNAPERQAQLCISYNPKYIITSSIGSFYIPCTIMLILYYSIFRKIQKRVSGKSRRLLQTRTDDDIFEATTLAKSSRKSLQTAMLEKSDKDSNEEELMDSTHTERARFAQSLNDSQHIFMQESNNGCLKVNSMEEITQDVGHTVFNREDMDNPSFNNMDEFRRHLRDRIRYAKRRSLAILPIYYLNSSGQRRYETSGGSGKDGSMSFHERFRRSIHHKCRRTQTFSASVEKSERLSENEPPAKGWLAKRKSISSLLGYSKERIANKREKKVTKTLAIVLGVFLICWMPFFTINILHAFCYQFRQEKQRAFCDLPRIVDIGAVWLGYINSSLNPVIYTIFNVEFRKAFKKILHCGQSV